MNDAQRQEFERLFFLYRKFTIAEAADMVIRFLWENSETCGMDPLKVKSLVELLADLRGCLLKGDG